MRRGEGKPKKRGRYYYANVRVNGIQLRDCLHTTDWNTAQERQKELKKKAEAGHITATTNKNREWLKYTLAEALDVLIEERKSSGKAERTIETDRERAKHIQRHIGGLRVSKATADTIQIYQQARQAEGTSKGRAINMEVTLIRLILKKAKRWARIAEDVTNLPESESTIASVLTEEQKQNLFQTACSKDDWYRAYYCGVIAVNTTGRKIEVLRARLRDVDFFGKVWGIPKSKTKTGVRQIELNDEALHAFSQMKRIVEQLGGGEPEHYFFPACESKRFDLTRHQKTVRTAWRKLTIKAGLKGFRIHDLRHQCITEMAENGTPPDVMEALAGHLSAKMRKHYTHIREQARRKAVAALPGTGLYRPPASERVVAKQ